MVESESGRGRRPAETWEYLSDTLVLESTLRGEALDEDGWLRRYDADDGMPRGA